MAATRAKLIGSFYGTTHVFCSLARSIEQDSKPALAVGSSQPVEPNASHLREPLIVRVKVIAQISRRVQSAHIHDADSLPSIGALGHNT